jgi:dsRNA-specific ribonuclease
MKLWLPTVTPLIVSDSLPEALAQIAELRNRLKGASTYNGQPLTPKMRDKLMATLDAMERDETKNARHREEERLSCAKETLDGAIKQRTAALTVATTAADWLADAIAKITSSHAAAVDAARAVGTELPDIKPNLQKLAQAIADALRPLAAITEGN